MALSVCEKILISSQTYTASDEKNARGGKRKAAAPAA